MTAEARNDVLLELALERGDEVGDGVSLGVGFVALWVRRSEKKDLFVVFDEEMRLEVELLQQELRGHAVGDDDVGDELLQHVAALEGLAEELLGADGGEEVQRGNGDLLELERGAGGADGGEERPDGGGEGLEVLDEEVGVVVDAARGDGDRRGYMVQKPMMEAFSSSRNVAVGFSTGVGGTERRYGRSGSRTAGDC